MNELEIRIKRLENEIADLDAKTDPALRREWRIKRSELAKAYYEAVSFLEESDPLSASHYLYSAFCMGHYAAFYHLISQSSTALQLAKTTLAPNQPVEKLFLKGVQALAGIGMPIQVRLSKQYLEVAAQQGYPHAQSLLGMLYFYGKPEEDYSLALSWFRSASEQGDPIGQYYLGQMYKLGDGVPEDAAMAYQMYAKSAEQGNVFAQTALGICYSEGFGVNQNKALGAELYTDRTSRCDFWV